MTNEKPNVLILGGVGFIGRHFVHYLISNQLANYIRVVDKVLPHTVHLSEQFKQDFEQIDFKQCNLTIPESIASCFDEVEFDYVFNFAAETKYSQSSEVYEDHILNLSVNCAKEAAKQNVKVFVQFSTAEVYDHKSGPSTEMSKIKPWTTMAKYKHKAEEELKSIEGLNLLIIRPAIVYGPGALSGLTPRLVIGRVYKYLNEEMKFLWSKDLKLNTVHVRDVSNASWLLAKWYVDNHEQGTDVPIFNLADKQDTDQETISQRIQSIFNIGTGYHNHAFSILAKLDLTAVVEEINEKHLAPWTKIIEENRIKSTPLSPFLDQELLYNHSLSIDGSKIEDETGFSYQIPYLTDENLIEIIDEFKALNIWPKQDIQ
ncbi:hypothetical protein G6F26_006919 [Rhizopus arrhizus]|nr:hypothetical protein G6F23_006775 [Rhizopus arrhizus]KAG1425429.1 hypothetical protein G6F58_001928 [Rhizopus delemar]KAG0764550.1 hypothetical protein G6F24_005135 [Rhizopus arrhizus]KAG0791174.1 hypothetical protein G6F21_005279 [Rhizopus arrhizus]KAG0854264.1 hypothetical protein G6F17_006506 [Rhizopus arrhizus]